MFSRACLGPTTEAKAYDSITVATLFWTSKKKCGEFFIT